MIADIVTIAWKELKELLQQRGRFRGGVVGLLIFTAAIGILIPLQTGPGWVNSPLNLFYWAWVPYLMVSNVTADTFAGERERHTLETLLASRLSDRAILYGKLSASVLYGWGLTMINVLIGLITVNIAFPGHGLLLFPLDLGLGVVFISLSAAAFAAGLGVLISLRAATVRQAQQTLSIVMFAIFLPLMILPLLPPLPLEWQLRLMDLLANAGQNMSLIIAGVVLFFVILDGILLALAQARFKRAKLILD